MARASRKFGPDALGLQKLYLLDNYAELRVVCVITYRGRNYA